MPPGAMLAEAATGMPMAAPVPVPVGPAADTSCAICWEPVEEGVVLPCACAASYCNRCWDRSLAHSLNACGSARCPTCRCPVRVDFEAATGRMIFSRDVGDGDEEEDMEIMEADDRQDASGGSSSTEEPEAEDQAASRDTTVAVQPGDHLGNQEPSARQGPTAAPERPPRARAQRVQRAARSSRRGGPWDAPAMDRLVQQARPAQQRLLRSYGAAHPELREAAVAAAAARSSAVEAQGERRLEELCAAAASRAPPPCVCGGCLGRVTYRERLVRCLRMRMPSVHLGMPEFDRFVDELIARGEPCYFCDVCGESKAAGAVWTCENGNNTVLHANAYDVCEKCFALYCSGAEAPVA